MRMGKEYMMRDAGSLGCTVGVIRLSGGMFFFKNRDLEPEYCHNQITVYQSTPDFHALKGVNLKTSDLEGVSIGVNRHRVCVANAHIASTPNVTYDVLCEDLLKQVSKRDDVRPVVEAFLSEHKVQGGKILVAALDWAFLLEVLGRQYEIQPLNGNFVMTNDFSLLDHRPKRPQVRDEGSANRLQVAQELIKTISAIGQLKAMLRSHLPQRGETSICNHRVGGGTETSHIVQIQGNYVGWSALVGYPCQNDYRTRQLFQG